MSGSTPALYDDVEACVDAIIAKVGRRIAFGLPIGGGKPVQLVNAMYARAKRDPSINLRIFTGLSLERPKGRSDLEHRFLGPFVDRVWGNYPDLDYLADVQRNCLPPNVEVSEFFFKAGAFLNNRLLQQTYVSSNYTDAVRDMLANGINVVAQIVSKKVVNGELFYSLSGNPDVAPQLVAALRERERHGQPAVVIGQVNNNLPFMYHDAMVSPSAFDMIVDNPAYDFTLFSTPNMPVDTIDYAIGLYVSSLIADGGTLQIGIGSLGDAIAHALILREGKNEDYKAILGALGATETYGHLIREVGGTERFEKGLYGASEMLVNGFVEMYKAGILRRRVYGHAGLQRLLNEEKIAETVSPAMLEQLALHGVIRSQLTAEDVVFLQSHGILAPGVTLDNGVLRTPEGVQIRADLGDPECLEALARHGLGERLTGGILMHGGFFLGPESFYDFLRGLSEEENKLFGMTSVDNVNQLYGNQELKALQRRLGRFANTCLMVTLNGGVISDGLEDGRVVSGVGGQYNFVAMANALPDARLIMMLRSTRESAEEMHSNVVWNYGHMTIPRTLRDIVVTEYGIANLRSKSDKDVIAELLNVTDSRYQEALLEKAKAVGKIPADYEIPERYRHNLPEVLAAKLAPFKQQLPAFPFGHSFTDEELVLARALKSLKEKMRRRVSLMAGGLLGAIRGGEVPEAAHPYLRRMGLQDPKTFKDKVVQSLLIAELAEGGHF